MNRFRNTTPWRSLPLWAACASIPAVLFAAFALPASPARADGPSDAPVVQVECGDRTPTMFVPAGTVLPVQYFDGPSADADSWEYMHNGDALPDIWNAWLAHVQAPSWIKCRGCDVPGYCVVWPIEITAIGQPEGEPYFYLDRDSYGGTWVVELVITADVAIEAICTDC